MSDPAPLPARLTRPPYERMTYIHERLQADKHPNCTTLAAHFEVSTKTIQRDIEFMRDRWQLPIEYDETKFGYYYSEPVENLPLVTMTEGELVALLVAQKAVEQYAGTAFEAPLTNAFTKLTAQLDGPVTVALGAARHVFSFKAAGPARADLELFRRLSQAVLENREIAFDYRGLGDAKPARRRVQPWHLCCVDSQWYLIGYDLNRAAKRTFAFPRISGVDLTRHTFARPAGFSIREHLGGSFGIIAGSGEYRVRLRFDNWAAQLVRERFWHDSQELTERRDGTVELALELDSLAEVERWILSWGEHVEVLAPKPLRERIAAVARLMAEKHGAATA
ncbi:MAG: WYL domain-containing transcriptional regulator [Opitutaceae bacterium]